MNAAERCRKAANSLYNRGLFLARERDLTGAAVHLKKALQLNRHHTDARNLLGLIFYETGEVGDALTQWVISMNLQPEGNRAERYLSDIQRKNGRLNTFDRMITQYNTALEIAKNGSHDTAVHQLSGVVSRHPNYIRAGLLLSLLYMEAGEWKKAGHYLNQVRDTDRNNPDALRYLEEVKIHLEREKDRPEKEEIKNAFSHRKMTDDDVIIPSTYHENTGWQTVMNIGIGLLIGASAILFLYMPTKTAELNRRHNQDLIEVSAQLSDANADLKTAQDENSALTSQRDQLQNQLNTIEESNTYKLSQYQKLAGILNDYRSENYSHAADLFATIDVGQLTDIDDDSGVSVTEIYNSIAGKMSAEGYVSLYKQGNTAYDAGDYETAMSYYDKALAINPDYGEAMFKKAMCYKQSGDIQSANNLFGEVIMKFPDTELEREAQAERGY